MNIYESNAPIPDLVRPGRRPFRVQPGSADNAATNMIERTMHAPFHDEGQGIRRHEMAHAAWSPDRPLSVEGIDGVLIIGLEEARVNLGSRKLGLPVFDVVHANDYIAAAAAVRTSAERAEGGHRRASSRVNNDFHETLLRALAGLFIDLRDTTGRCLDVDALVSNPGVIQIRDEARRELLRLSGFKAVCTFEEMLALARKLQLMFPEQPWLPSTVSGAAITSPGDVGCLTAECARHMRMRQAGLDSPERSQPELRDAMVAVWGGPLPQGYGQPGELMLVQPALSVPTVRAAGSHGRARLSAEEGAVVRSPHRWAVDGAIFGRHRKRRAGGTVLVDNSGSMRWSDDDLQAVLAQATGSTTVAVYEGVDNHGELTVLARNGRRVASVPRRRWGENIIDAPALAWLGQQRQPRIWYSDGKVTGCGGSASRELLMLCEKLRVAGKITRLLSWDDILAMLAGQERPSLTLADVDGEYFVASGGFFVSK